MRPGKRIPITTNLPGYERHIVDTHGNILESSLENPILYDKIVGRNIKEFFGIETMSRYMYALHMAIIMNELRTIKYKVHGTSFLCSIQPLDDSVVMAHEVRVIGNMEIAAKLLLRIQRGLE